MRFLSNLFDVQFILSFTFSSAYCTFHIFLFLASVRCRLRGERYQVRCLLGPPCRPLPALSLQSGVDVYIFIYIDRQKVCVCALLVSVFRYDKGCHSTPRMAAVLVIHMSGAALSPFDCYHFSSENAPDLD